MRARRLLAENAVVSFDQGGTFPLLQVWQLTRILAVTQILVSDPQQDLNSSWARGIILWAFEQAFQYSDGALASIRRVTGTDKIWLMTPTTEWSRRLSMLRVAD